MERDAGISRWTRSICGAAALLACLMLTPAAGKAATVIGSDLSAQPAGAGTCGANPGDACNLTPKNLPSGAPYTGSPVAGVVVSARIRTAGAAMNVAVRVLHENPMTPYLYLNVGPEAVIPVTADATAAGHTTEQTGLHIPITVGDRPGVGYTMPASFFSIGGSNGSAECAYRLGASLTHPVGTEANYNDFGCAFEVLAQGTVEPDADGDRFGDETQDGCPANPAVQTACPVPQTTKKKRKCKKKRKSAAAAKKKCKKRKP